MEVEGEGFRGSRMEESFWFMANIWEVRGSNPRPAKLSGRFSLNLD